MRRGRQYRFTVMLMIAVFLYGCSPVDIEKDIDRTVAYTGSYQHTTASQAEETTTRAETETPDIGGDATRTDPTTVRPPVTASRAETETPDIGGDAVETDPTSVRPPVTASRAVTEAPGIGDDAIGTDRITVTLPVNTLPETAPVTAVSGSASVAAVVAVVPPHSSPTKDTSVGRNTSESIAPGTTAETGWNTGGITVTQKASSAESSSSVSSAESTAASTVAQTSAPEPGTLAVADFTQSIPAGETAIITVVCKPNTLYTITVTYKSGPSEAKGLEQKMSDAGGQVTWTWKVGSRTSAGSWPIRVSGGGEEVTVYFQVV